MGGRGSTGYNYAVVEYYVVLYDRYCFFQWLRVGKYVISLPSILLGYRQVKASRLSFVFRPRLPGSNTGAYYPKFYSSVNTQ